MKKKIFSILLAACLIASCFAGCSTQSSDEQNTTVVTTTAKQTDDSNFKLSYTQADSLDPFKAKTQNNQVLASLVFESLFDLDENYEPQPNIAKAYSYADNKTIKIELNNNLTFSNGSVLSADDVVYSINNALSSPAYGNALSCISSAYKSDSDVMISLKYDNPYAVNLLTFPIVCASGKSSFPIGSGRYSYANDGNDVVLKATKANGFNPYITTIKLVNIAASDSIDNAVNIGNISYAFRDMSSDVSKRMSCAKKAVMMNNLVYIGVNSYSGITSNAQIRRAISLAADRTVLAQSAYSGYAEAATSVFNPDFKSAGDVKLFSTTADTSAAKTAVAQSGYSAKDLSISILVDTSENKNSCANLLKIQLESAGFKVSIDKQKTSAYKSKIKSNNFELYIGEVKLSDDMSLYPFFGGGVKYGINLKNLKCDDLYANYLSGKCELGKFVLSFNEELPYIPLLYKKGMICYSKAMNGDMQGYYGNFFTNIDSWNFNS